MPVEWEKLVAELATYESAALTSRDADGYPTSVRCHPRPDDATRTLALADEVGLAEMREGPASLLCHWHDARLWRQRSFLTRGKLARDGAGWRFTPVQVVPGVSQKTVALGRFFFHARGVAGAYLAKRRLARPRIPWEDVLRIKAEARANLRARGGRV